MSQVATAVSGDHFASKMPLVLCVLVFLLEKPGLQLSFRHGEAPSMEISVGLLMLSLQERHYLLFFEKIEYTIPSAFVQGVSSHLSAHAL